VAALLLPEGGVPTLPLGEVTASAAPAGK
jgi:hypothetical protein